MLGRDLLAVLQAEPIHIGNSINLDKDYQFVFASDLMSDVLAMVQTQTESTVLLTGLCNAQSLRTAEMLDLELIIFCRNKQLPDDAFDVAESLECNIYKTSETMFTACGHLFKEGMRGIDDVVDA